jgi:8-oxo-dGTP diphosphatase
VPFTYDHPRPALAVDCVVFGLSQEGLAVLLVERALPPFEGSWALPGGFVHMDETLDAAARRELVEESGVELAHLEQLYTFGAPGRDPRERVVSVAYFALVKQVDHALRAASDARRAAWFPVRSLPELAFDHAEIVATGIARLRSKVRYRPLGFDLLPERFTLTQLQRLYEAILDRPLDKRNFRKKVLGLGLVAPTAEHQSGVRHRAAQLFRFDRAAYERLEERGIDLDLV